MTCKTAPGVTFTSRQELAEHCRSDWHRLNLKRIAAGQCPISEAEFQAAADDLSSLSGSASEIDEDDDADDDAAALKDLYAAQRAPSLRVGVGAASDDDDAASAPARAAPIVAAEGPGVKGRVGIWRVLLPLGWGDAPGADGGGGADRAAPLGPALLPLKRGLVAYLFASGGHFAGSVFQGHTCLLVTGSRADARYRPGTRRRSGKRPRCWHKSVHCSGIGNDLQDMQEDMCHQRAVSRQSLVSFEVVSPGAALLAGPRL